MPRLERLLEAINSVLVTYQHTAYLSTLQAYHRRAVDLKDHSPRGEDVEKLENEWWASEVVAVWYGPIPGRVSSDQARTRALTQERGDGEGGLKRDTSRVALYDD